VKTGGLLDRLCLFFEVQERGSTLGTEVLAGVSTFLALSYIFVVNPSILAAAGMNREAVFFATVVTSAAATAATGLWARLPFALAPGMEMNAYLAYFVVGSLHVSWQRALGAVFWSGVLFLLVTVSGVRKRIIASIPGGMKKALSVSVGTFIALVGLRVAGVLRYTGTRLAGLGALRSRETAVLGVGLLVVAVLQRFRVRAAVLLGIIAASIAAFGLGLGGSVRGVVGGVGGPLSAVGELELGGILDTQVVAVIIILFVLEFYGSVAKFIALSSRTSITSHGELPRLQEALMIDGAASAAGGVLGTSSVTAYVESSVGINIGGRTGMTAVMCAILMLACLPLAWLLRLTPAVATAGGLVYVGFALLPKLSDLRSYSWVDGLSIVVMQALVVWTFALDKALFGAFLVYSIGELLSRRRVNPYLLVSTLLLALGVGLQVFGG
jgi:AGZA family xanthine/uracil permease-like MFS transporter